MKKNENNILKGNISEDLLVEINEFNSEIQENYGAGAAAITLGKVCDYITKNMKCGNFLTLSAECSPTKTSCWEKLK